MSKKKSLKTLLEWSNKYIEENKVQKIEIYYDDEIVIFAFNSRASIQLKNDGIIFSYLKYILLPLKNKNTSAARVSIDPYYNRMDIVADHIDLNIIGKDVGSLFFELNAENLLDFSITKKSKKAKIYRKTLKVGKKHE